MSALRPLVVILGPTASGKSALAIHLAEELGGEIISCDSTQVYRDFDIGTAKVPVEQQHGIPHHLIDLVQPEEVFTAGEYRHKAILVLDEISRRGRLTILTAGTGLYLRALLEGLADAPERSEELRERLRMICTRRGAEYLHRMLERLDPESAARIAPRDSQKAIRAIEVRLVAGESVGKLHQRRRAGLEGYKVTKIGLLPPREALYSRIDHRVREMLQAGWLHEVKRLMKQGIDPNCKPFDFLGYSQLRDHAEGKISLADAIAGIQKGTHQYAKRQITWFRKEKDVFWIQAFGDDSGALSQALAVLKNDIGRPYG